MVDRDDGFPSILRYRLIDRLLEAEFRLNTHKTFDDLAIFEDHQRGDAVYAVTRGRVGTIVHIYLGDFHRAGVLFSQLLHDGGYQASINTGSSACNTSASKFVSVTSVTWSMFFSPGGSIQEYYNAFRPQVQRVKNRSSPWEQPGD
jgi:hypothetical protein